jgi:hypothetical protein
MQLALAGRRRSVEHGWQRGRPRRLQRLGVDNECTPIIATNVNPSALKAQHTPRRIVDRRRRDRMTAGRRDGAATRPVARSQSTVRRRTADLANHSATVVLHT